MDTTSALSNAVTLRSTEAECESSSHQSAKEAPVSFSGRKASEVRTPESRTSLITPPTSTVEASEVREPESRTILAAPPTSTAEVNKSELMKTIEDTEVLILCAKGDKANVLKTWLVKECEDAKISHYILEVPKFDDSADDFKSTEGLSLSEELEVIQKFHDKPERYAQQSFLCLYISDSFKKAMQREQINNFLTKEIFSKVPNEKKNENHVDEGFPVIYSNKADSTKNVKVPLCLAWRSVCRNEAVDITLKKKLENLITNRPVKAETSAKIFNTVDSDSAGTGNSEVIPRG